MNMRDEIYEVTITREVASGVAVSESWRNQAGRRHRPDGPAEIKRDPITGVITNEAWFQNGQSHRVDGPAIITRHAKTGVTTYSAWYSHDEKIKAPKRSGSRSRTTRTTPRPLLG